MLAVHTVYVRPYTTDLGTEVMLRLGPHSAEALDGLAKEEWNKAAAKLPGFIGNANPEVDVSRMRMGTNQELRVGRRYEAF